MPFLSKVQAKPPLQLTNIQRASESRRLLTLHKTREDDVFDPNTRVTSTREKKKKTCCKQIRATNLASEVCDARTRRGVVSEDNGVSLLAAPLCIPFVSSATTQEMKVSTSES